MNVPASIGSRALLDRVEGTDGISNFEHSYVLMDHQEEAAEDGDGINEWNATGPEGASIGRGETAADALFGHGQVQITNLMLLRYSTLRQLCAKQPQQRHPSGGITPFSDEDSKIGEPSGRQRHRRSSILSSGSASTSRVGPSVSSNFTAVAPVPGLRARSHSVNFAALSFWMNNDSRNGVLDFGGPLAGGRFSQQFVNPDVERQYRCYVYMMEWKNVLVAQSFHILFFVVLLTLTHVEVGGRSESGSSVYNPSVLSHHWLSYVLGCIVIVMFVARQIARVYTHGHWDTRRRALQNATIDIVYTSVAVLLSFTAIGVYPRGFANNDVVYLYLLWTVCSMAVGILVDYRVAIACFAICVMVPFYVFTVALSGLATTQLLVTGPLIALGVVVNFVYRERFFRAEFSENARANAVLVSLEHETCLFRSMLEMLVPKDMVEKTIDTLAQQYQPVQGSVSEVATDARAGAGGGGSVASTSTPFSTLQPLANPQGQQHKRRGSLLGQQPAQQHSGAFGGGPTSARSGSATLSARRTDGKPSPLLPPQPPPRRPSLTQQQQQHRQSQPQHQHSTRSSDTSRPQVQQNIHVFSDFFIVAVRLDTLTYENSLLLSLIQMCNHQQLLHGRGSRGSLSSIADASPEQTAVQSGAVGSATDVFEGTTERLASRYQGSSPQGQQQQQMSSIRGPLISTPSQVPFASPNANAVPVGGGWSSNITIGGQRKQTVSDVLISTMENAEVLIGIVEKALEALGPDSAIQKLSTLGNVVVIGGPFVTEDKIQDEMRNLAIAERTELKRRKELREEKARARAEQGQQATHTRAVAATGLADANATSALKQEDVAARPLIDLAAHPAQGRHGGNGEKSEDDDDDHDDIFNLARRSMNNSKRRHIATERYVKRALEDLVCFLRVFEELMQIACADEESDTDSNKEFSQTMDLQSDTAPDSEVPLSGHVNVDTEDDATATTATTVPLSVAGRGRDVSTSSRRCPTRQTPPTGHPVSSSRKLLTALSQISTSSSSGSTLSALVLPSSMAAGRDSSALSQPQHCSSDGLGPHGGGGGPGASSRLAAAAALHASLKQHSCKMLSKGFNFIDQPFKPRRLFSAALTGGIAFLGVVGTRHPTFDVFGTTVSTALALLNATPNGDVVFTNTAMHALACHKIQLQAHDPSTTQQDEISLDTLSQGATRARHERILRELDDDETAFEDRATQQYVRQRWRLRGYGVVNVTSFPVGF